MIASIFLATFPQDIKIRQNKYLKYILLQVLNTIPTIVNPSNGGTSTSEIAI